MQKKIKIELWFKISVEWHHFLVRLKRFLPILSFVTFLTTSPTFPKTHIFECTRYGVVPYTVENLKSQWRHSGVFIVDFKNIEYLVLVFLLLNLNM